ncbi:glycoside hydrolase family 2 [Paenibacillus sp. MY03]|uniref:glycoside hydrolase family 2 protein n=1 Tax=Paenibacillus sp. MY03 TaxID=302980 RepID=UPI000B3BEA45|nr:sugar-binding domain-containing protein [Paenibacillus sp. MY03]OUS71348.1 glycoside hydrolase family 2 [Paenibacillus sp. MY03]
MSTIYRSEHPRPQFMRDSWLNLNGEWEFAFDDENTGTSEGWHKGDRPLPLRIQVPFAFQSKLSGIADPAVHDTVWYRRPLDIPAEFAGKKTILHFGAVDYLASVWVNGVLVATHEGGHTPFQADITDALREADNWLVVKAIDFSRDTTLPRGKQFWLDESASIFYTRTTGIWQTVWMEAVATASIDRVRMIPDIDRNAIELHSYFRGTAGRSLKLKVEVTYEGEPVVEETYNITDDRLDRTIGLRDLYDRGASRHWSPQHPRLYDIVFSLIEGDALIDQATSYFGMRKVSIEGGKLCLNNRPFFSKMVLDQGYFPDGNLTPPSDEAIRKDVELTKEMGFNGARKHQKLEDPRYLYWCDKLGLVVWSEAANAYQFTEEYVQKFTKEWMESVERDANHPSIIAWVPLNESWGVPNIQVDKQQQDHAMAMYYLTKSLDPTRPVISNDGWELVKTDLFNIHDYEWRREVLEERYSTVENAIEAMPANRRLAVEGYPYAGQPILLTEFGGISYKKSDWEGWGYSGADNDEDFEQRLRAVIQPFHGAGSVVQGYCYTQLTDVEQEINGLLTYDRIPKIPLELIRAINEGK